MNNNDMSLDKENVIDTPNQSVSEKHKESITFKVRKSHHVPTKNNVKKVQLEYDQVTNKISKIKKEIEFLTNLLPPYNVEVDYHTRTKITRAMGKLQEKIDELEKTKYNLGITLSRLWRDLDDSDIWVRNVSN